jgi:hypothetical protein
MTSRRTIREELGQLPPDLDLGTTPEQIMRRGRRIRLTRQGLVVGAAAVAVIGVTTTATTLTGHRAATNVIQPAAGGVGVGLASSPAPAPASKPLPTPTSELRLGPSPSDVPTSAPAVTSTCVPQPQATTGAPAAPQAGAANEGNPPPWGNLIEVGTDSNGKHVVLYGYPIGDAQLPCTHFGLMLGTKDLATAATSGVTGIYATNEFAGSDIAPGFHGTSLSGGGNQVQDWYVIGYYVGPAATISIPLNGVATPATVAPWSVNPDVKIWWVSGKASVPAFGTPSAKDAQGKPLPNGTNAGPPAVG